MDNSWIKLHRKLLEWEWLTDDTVFRLWIFILLSANFDDRKWRGREIPRGGFVTSVKHLSETLKLSNKKIRRGLKCLENSGNVTIKTTNKFTMVIVCNYDIYQAKETTEGQAEGQTKGKQRANKGQQDKNIRREEYIETTNESKVNNNLSLSYQGGMGERAADEAAERERIFLLFFLKFGNLAADELNRFWEHYESQGWRKSNGMKVTDRVALARWWDKKPDAKSTIPENFLKCLAPAVKKHQPPAVILYGIRAAVRNGDTVTVTATDEAARWMEDHIADIRPTFRRIYGKETQLNYIINKQNTNRKTPPR